MKNINLPEVLINFNETLSREDREDILAWLEDNEYAVDDLFELFWVDEGD